MDEEVTQQSEKYLHDWIASLTEEQRKHVGLMGGWAVHLLLEKFGGKHIGSRDIDIFFDPTAITYEEVTEKIKEMGFTPHSTFRLIKYVHRPTGKPLSIEESKKDSNA